MKYFAFSILFIFLLSCSSTEESVPDTSEILSSEVKDTIHQIPIIKEIPLLEKRINRNNVTDWLQKYGSENHENIVDLVTSFGTIKLKLYQETPLHRANFVMLSKKTYYDRTIFYRIEKDFVIQGGNTDQVDDIYGAAYIGNYKIPNEFSKKRFHKRGALAMTKAYHEETGVPRDSSDAFSFYIVQGQKFSAYRLDAIEDRYGIRIPKSHKKIYETIGGAPHLDGIHTVFGEVIEGMSVVDKIAEVSVDESKWPLQQIPLKMIVNSKSN